MASPSWSEDSARVAHVVIITIFSFLALLAVILRLWARKVQRHTWDVSDYLIIVGLIWALGLSMFTIHSNIYWDLGGDLTQIGNPNAIQGLVILEIKALLVGIITWGVAVFFIRASILALYIRIFRTKSFRKACYITHGFNAAFFVTNILAPCLICRPISFQWDFTIPGGTCGDQKALDLYIGIVNLLLDVAMVILPMPVLWGLQMATNKKVMLSFMFGLGVVICAITIVRIRITVENHGSNSQKIYSLIALFTCLEALLGVINACFPVMKPLFSKLDQSKAMNWLSSVMSGTIPIFMRPSQMGSNGKTTSQSAPSTRRATSKHPLPKEMRKWHGHCNRGSDVNGSFGPRAKGTPLPPRYVDNKPAGMMFSPTYPSMSSPATRQQTPRPPVPPKGPCCSPEKRWEPADKKDGVTPGTYMQKSWDHDTERGFSEDTDRDLLNESPKQEYDNRW